MAERNPPSWLQAGSHPAEHDRLLMQSVAAGLVEGVVGFTDLVVSEKSGTPDMSVDVAAGAAFVRGDESVFQGTYHVQNDAATNVTVAASDPTNPRWDLVVAQVEDSDYSGATDAWSLAVVTGTAAASPSDPTVPDNALVLARVVVPASASSITDSDITDLRPFSAALGGLIRCNSARRPGVLYGPTGTVSPTEGMKIFELDTNKELLYDGANWIQLTPESDYVAANESLGATGTFSNLTTAGPAVTIETATEALVIVGAGYLDCSVAFPGTQPAMGFAISGATTRAASSADAFKGYSEAGFNVESGEVTVHVTGLTPGSNIFTAKYLSGGAAQSFGERRITAVGLP